jgi:nucleotide-binding universal stress UspA family protein
MKRILVATDGSEGADHAVDYAAQWAKNQNADLLIVNVIGGVPDRLLRSFTHAQHAWLDELLESLAAETLAKARDRAHRAGAGWDRAIPLLGKRHVVFRRTDKLFVEAGLTRMRQNLVDASTKHDVAAQK